MTESKMNEIFKLLQSLKGINVDSAYRIFREKKMDVKRKGFTENLVAFLLDKRLPKNTHGMDFPGLFEVKEVKIHYTKRKKEMRTGGDTAISAYMNDVEFFKSNIWEKSSKILIVCVDEHKTIRDIRFFDGEKLADDMKSDYELIKSYKNQCRKENKYLVFKTGRNSIMLKGNTAIDKSVSVFFDSENEIQDQYKYISDLFDSKFENYKENVKSYLETIKLLGERLSVSELEEVIEDFRRKISESYSFNLTAGDELTF